MMEMNISSLLFGYTESLLRVAYIVFFSKKKAILKDNGNCCDKLGLYVFISDMIFGERYFITVIQEFSPFIILNFMEKNQLTVTSFLHSISNESVYLLYVQKNLQTEHVTAIQKTKMSRVKSVFC